MKAEESVKEDLENNKDDSSQIPDGNKEGKEGKKEALLRRTSMYAASFLKSGKEIEKANAPVLQELSVQTNGVLKWVVFISFMTASTWVSYAYFMIGMSFVDSLYFFFVTASSVGYGDLKPTSKLNRVFFSVMIVVGIVMNSLLVGILLTMASDLDTKEEKKRKQNQRMMKVTQKDTGEITLKEVDANVGLGYKIQEFALSGIAFVKYHYMRMHKAVQDLILSTADVAEADFAQGDIREVMTCRDDADRNVLIEELRYLLKRKMVKMVFNIMITILLFVVTLFVGAWIIAKCENWKYDDALYFSLVTLTTIGYGDFSPVTEKGRLFTCFFILFGCVIFAITVSYVAMVPLVYRKRSSQLAVLEQFGGDLSDKTVRAIVQSEFWKDFPELRSQNNAVLKGEFIVMLLYMMKKVTSQDIQLCAKVFAGLDILANSRICLDDLAQDSGGGGGPDHGAHTMGDIFGSIDMADARFESSKRSSMGDVSDDTFNHIFGGNSCSGPRRQSFMMGNANVSNFQAKPRRSSSDGSSFSGDEQEETKERSPDTHSIRFSTTKKPSFTHQKGVESQQQFYHPQEHDNRKSIADMAYQSNPMFGGGGSSTSLEDPSSPNSSIVNPMMQQQRGIEMATRRASNAAVRRTSTAGVPPPARRSSASKKKKEIVITEDSAELDFTAYLEESFGGILGDD